MSKTPELLTKYVELVIADPDSSEAEAIFQSWLMDMKSEIGSLLKDFCMSPEHLFHCER